MGCGASSAASDSTLEEPPSVVDQHSKNMMLTSWQVRTASGHDRIAALPVVDINMTSKSACSSAKSNSPAAGTLSATTSEAGSLVGLFRQRPSKVLLDLEDGSKGDE